MVVRFEPRREEREKERCLGSRFRGEGTKAGKPRRVSLPLSEISEILPCAKAAREGSVAIKRASRLKPDVF